MPNLIFERGREKGTTFELKPDAPCVAGRDPTAVQIVLSDPAASRRHFQVTAKGGKWFVADLGSRNHTYLNEEKLDIEIELNSGDRIQVGETVLSFLDEDKGDKSAAQGLNGKEIGGYKILDRLGRGGMGTVFKAKQISLNRVVALKVLASKFARDPKFVERFVSEARAAGQLNHPNVVQVFDVGQLGGLHFFSMELMEGGCVQDLLSAAPEGRLTWQEAMPLILDAARGLVFAEKRGIIHRDIKPDNLMLTSEQRVKIGDLGLAKKAEEGAGDKQIFGTPHFIAPEQAQGKDLTHSADLYALGATFYRMVTGRTPFSGETVKEILKKQINDAHQPIPQVVPDFPPDLAAIVDKLMAKKVENRYQSATKLVEDLEAFQLAHQIELSGARKMNKPLMIGLVLVTLGAIGVGIHFAMQDPKTEYVPGKTITEIVRVGTTGEVLTDEARTRMLVQDARSAYLEIKADDGALGPIDLAKKDAFLKIAGRYDELVTKFPNPHPRVAEAIKPGLDRAQEIRDSLKRMEDDLAAQIEAARTWWDNWKKKRDEMEKERKWVEIMRSAERWLKDVEAAKHMLIVKEAKDELTKTEERELGLAEKSFQESLDAAKEQFEKGGENAEKAIESLEKWADDLEKSNPTHERLKVILQAARDWLADRKGDVHTILLQVLDQEKVTYVEAARGVRQGGSGAGLVFDFQFEAAANQFQAATASLKTYPYQERAAKRASRLHAEQKAWAGWIQLLGEGRIFNAGDELKGLPAATAGVKYTLNLTTPPTIGHFTVDTVLPGGQGKGSKAYQWDDLTREDFATIFALPKADKLPGDEALGMAWVFVEMGHGVAAQAMLDRAAASGAQIPAEEETALRREINVIKDYDALRQLVGGEPNAVVAAVMAWREKAAGTDTYLLLDGRPAAELQVMGNDVIDEYVKNLGKKK